jgi:hypothetical protein
MRQCFRNVASPTGYRWFESISLQQRVGCEAWPWPVGVLLTLALRDSIGWRGIRIIIGIGALVIFVLRFSLPESCLLGKILLDPPSASARYLARP